MHTMIIIIPFVSEAYEGKVQTHCDPMQMNSMQMPQTSNRHGSYALRLTKLN